MRAFTRGLLGIAGFLVLWELLGRSPLIPAHALPPPSDVFGELVTQLTSPDFISHVVATVLALLIAIVIAVAIANLNAAMAKRYGLDGHQDGALLVVTVRDAAGNALPAGDLQLTATATVLPDPPKGLQLQPIRVDGLTDYIGVFAARPPASVQFRVTAVRNGVRTEMTTTAELYPR